MEGGWGRGRERGMGLVGFLGGITGMVLGGILKKVGIFGGEIIGCS